MVRLSVIIPGYNTPEAWWKRCVDSVLKAIGPEDEIVLVDDGSREGLRVAEFESLKGLDGRIRIITKANGGLSSARNAALEVVSGRYVAFVDSDDVVLPEVYSKSIAAMERFGSDVAIFGVRTEWVREGLSKDDVPALQSYPILLPADIKRLSDACLMNYAWNKVYRTDFLRTHQLRFDPEGMPCEDIIFNLHCVMSGARWCSVDSVGYVYYRVTGGRTILTSYKPTNHRGLALGADAWRRYCETLSADDATPFLSRTRISERQLLSLEWKNIWMPGTPYSIVGRWRWLKEHPSMGGVKAFLRMGVYMFLRRHFYIRPIRRWHIRRLYPHVVSV